MDIHAVSAARRIGTAVLALVLFALGLPVPLIPLADWLMPPNRAASQFLYRAPKVAAV
ncbi:MAG: hypothetical protein SFV20_12105 [Sphingopyxis sp.]|nr:hypothetical protein [Sphingopyxis sp.]